ncbi:isochorismatase [Chitinimonas prasina]|uniref:isochorismatase n=1 Tax=Chitinimonas prasina TaxID=1434937 RepID=A0ABQ5YEV3_9NEIS|nr:isochorismatase family protein [Chitinimonas prasina]GLR12173.1 isochorismatase [Chitinimonas prasina]
MTIPRIATYPMPTTLPENRVDWLPEPNRAVLLIHDMQQYFLDFYDHTAAPIPSLIAHIQALRQACDAVGIPVVYTAQPGEQSPEERGLLTEWWGPGITAQPQLAPVVAALAPREQDVVLTKWRYSAFARSDLEQRMRAQGRDQLIICGIYAHIGCQVTAADAFMRDIRPIYVGDAVADFSAEEHAGALAYVSRRCGAVRSTQDVLAALRPQGKLPADQAALLAEVARMLQMQPSDLYADDNLIHAGLDSIRLMSLVEGWRAAGAQVGFAEMAEQPTIAQWWALLSRQGN